jgi:hypothetical protein
MMGIEVDIPRKRRWFATHDESLENYRKRLLNESILTIGPP